MRIHIVIIALLAGLATFFAVQWLFNRYGFEEPLSRTLKASPFVQSFQIEKKGRLTLIIIRPRPVENLKEAYQSLYRDLQAVSGKRSFQLEFQDNRDQELRKVFYYSQFAIYEAIARGNFREMIGFIEEKAAPLNVQVLVFLDQDNIYLQMKHHGHYLYEVIPRGNYILRATAAPS